MNQQSPDTDSSKKSSLKRWGLLIILLLSLAGYVRLGFLISEGKVATSFFSASLQVPEVVIDKKVFGYSVEGKAIEGYVVGRGENTLLLFSSIHGDEIGTTDLLNTFVDEIKANPSLVSSNNTLIIIPIVNPDGYYDRTDKLNANRVNINLNFATDDWRNYGPEGTYAGSKPFSEVESQVLQQIVQEYSPDLMISYHASGALVNPENNIASIALGRWYAKETGYDYYDAQNLNWDYPGTATKWFTQTTHNPAITVELTTYTQSDWEKNKKALFGLASSQINFLEE